MGVTWFDTNKPGTKAHFTFQIFMENSKVKLVDNLRNTDWIKMGVVSLFLEYYL
jgi:hypothetical protein